MTKAVVGFGRDIGRECGAVVARGGDRIYFVRAVSTCDEIGGG